MIIASCDRHWLRTLTRVVAVNCVGGAIPAAFLLMIDSHVSRANVLQSLIGGAVFAPWLAPQNPFDPAALDLSNALLPPAWTVGGDPRLRAVS